MNPYPITPAAGRSKPAKLPELLAPAGSEDSLRAALAAGADAVYFGGTSFSNRMRAKNFSDDALTDAIRLCHSAGAKANITVNTRVRDRETDDALSLCEKILGSSSPDDRADAIICTDFGLAREILRRWPHAVLHASTQTSLSSPADCRELARLGFSRLVVPRELSAEEIAMLCAEGRKTGFEIEMFLHGAHCVSLSGQCLLSFVMGGRSGNRGECAQPCRLPFSVESVSDSDPTPATPAPLSLADLCLAGRISEVIRTGVASLKLEGRLKPAGYVYGVTSIYRRLLDEDRNADRAELHALEELFTRGFTDGYFVRRYASMNGRAVTDSADGGRKADLTGEISRGLKERLAHRGESRTDQPLTARFRFRSNEPMRLTLICGSVSASAEGEIPRQAEGKPLDCASAARNLTKFGGTGFSLPPDAIEYDMEDGLWVPVSSLNALRRTALSALSALSAQEKPEKPLPPTEPPAVSEEPSEPDAQTAHPIPSETDKPLGRQFRTAEFADASLLFSFSREELAEFAAYFRRIYVPYDRAGEAAALLRPLREEAGESPSPDGAEIGAVLPPLTPDDGALRRILRSTAESGIMRVMCHTPGQLALAAEAGLRGDLSFRANVTSLAALAAWRSTGLPASITLSPELPEGALRAIGDHALPGALRRPAGAIVYGKIPVMTLSRCLICGGKCRKGNAGGRTLSAKPHACRAVLVDRKGEEFPAFSLPDCETLICNSVPIWAGDRLTALRPLSFLSFCFTDETPAAALRVIRAYREGLPGVGRRL